MELDRNFCIPGISANHWIIRIFLKIKILIVQKSYRGSPSRNSAYLCIRALGFDVLWSWTSKWGIVIIFKFFMIPQKLISKKCIVVIPVIIANNRLNISGRLIWTLHLVCQLVQEKIFRVRVWISCDQMFEMQNVIEGDLFTELSPVCLLPPPYPLTHMDRGRLILSIFGYISPDLVLNNHPELLAKNSNKHILKKNFLFLKRGGIPLFKGCK